MQRCWLSYTRSARAAHSRLLSGHRRATATPWLPKWLSYSTASAGNRYHETLESSPDLSTGDLQLLRLREGLVPESHSSQQGVNDDALNFILEGYEAQPRKLKAKASNRRPPRIARSTSATVPGLRRPETKRVSFQKPRPRKAIVYGAQEKEKKRKSTVEGKKVSVEARILRPTQNPVQTAKTSPKPQSSRKQMRRRRRRITTLLILKRAGVRPVIGDDRPSFNKWITLRPYTAQPQAWSNWNTNFARINKEADVRALRENSVTYRSPWFPGWVEKSVKKVRKDFGGVFKIRPRSMGHKLLNVEYQWSQVALWLLHHDKVGMVDFLLTEGHPRSIPTHYISDSLSFLACYFTQVDTADSAHQCQRLAEAFCTLAKRPIGDPLVVETSFIRLLLLHCTDEQINSIYKTIKTEGVKVHWNTFLNIADYFAKHDHFHQGLDALLEAHYNGADLASSQFRSVCTTLLRKCMAQPGGLRACLRILDNLVKIGLSLNTQLCNVIMLNAVEAGDVKTAFAIYSSLVENKVYADDYTYAILLKGCKHVQNDVELLNATIRSAIEHVDVEQNPVVACEILHCLALHHIKHNRDEAWNILCQAYARLFDLDPLLKLGLPVQSSITNSQPANTSPPPAPSAIGIMIRTYMQLVYEGENTISEGYKIFKRYSALLESGEEPFLTLATTDHCYNAFLAAFTKSQRSLIHAAEVMKDMQRPSSAPYLVFGKCKPTVQTWNIFLHGFTRHNKMALAEQVLDHMRKSGMEPDRVTYNTLLSGYAGAQNLEGTLDTLRRADASGEAWTAWTHSGLGRFRDVQKLREELQKKQTAAALDFTDDLKQGLGERLASSPDDQGREDTEHSNI